MIRAITFVFAVLVAMPIFAQSQIATENSTAAELRTLDTLTGVVKDMVIEVGQTQSYERLTQRQPKQ